MAQAGRGRKLRKTRKATPEALVAAGTQAQLEAEIRRGVVPGAVAEQCPVCSCPSEGWHIEGGKRTWYHFSRAFPCVEKYDHVDGPGAVPDVS